MFLDGLSSILLDSGLLKFIFKTYLYFFCFKETKCSVKWKYLLKAPLRLHQLRYYLAIIYF